MPLIAEKLAPEFDAEAATTFAQHTVGAALNAGAVAIMLGFGHRLGLFDVMAKLPPSTSDEIAASTGLSARYVREWLAVMVTGRIVVHDPDSDVYALPAEHAACLTHDAPFGNFALYGQFLTLMGQAQDHVLDGFRTGSGAAYRDYPCFHEIMAEASRQKVADQLSELILPLVEGIEERLDEGIDVLDAGCGRGESLVAMAKRFPRSRFVGYDLCPDVIAFANAAARAEGLTNIDFEIRNLTGYDEKARYDFITSFDAVHDQKDPQGLICGLRGALKPNGVYLMQDIGGSAKVENNMDFPMAPLLYAISCVHCMPISLGQGGAGLGTMWGWETAQAMLDMAGFRDVTKHTLPHDPLNVWFVARL